MLTKKRYSVIEGIIWTRHETLLLLFYALVITALYEKFDFHFLRVPWTPLALVGTAVAFLIGFQNNAAYGRIWEARTIWGAITNSSRTFAMKVQDMIRPTEEINKDEIKLIHKTLIHRHIAWLTALRYSLRESRSWEDGANPKLKQEMESRIFVPEYRESFQNEMTKYLPLKELDYVVSKDNTATAILFLQSRHLRKLKEAGILWQFAFLNLSDVLQDLTKYQGQAERIKSFPYPRQYATITHWFIWIFIILLPFGIVPEFKETGVQLGASLPGIESQFVWLSVPFCTLVSWVFHTMDKIGRVGENPFEGTPNDVPISSIARSIEIDLRQNYNEPINSIPERFKDDCDVQM